MKLLIHIGSWLTGRQNLLICFSMFVASGLSGQSDLSRDTVRINEVVIFRKQFDSDPQGYKKTVIDSTVLGEYGNRTLAEILTDNSVIQVKSYGPGSAATPSLRGTSAGHTQVDWNGININSPMLGQSDLSLVQSEFTDDISIYYGGASMSLNSGGIGGIINLSTLPAWNKQGTARFAAGTGSFGKYSLSGKMSTGNLNFQSVTRGFYTTSENDFSYLNSVMSSEPYREIRTNSSEVHQGLMQEFFLRKNGFAGTARVWYQSSDRDLPGSLLVQPVNTGERQSDEILRTLLEIKKNSANLSYSFTGGWLISNLNYVNDLASIDSRNHAETFVLKGGMESRISRHTWLKITATDEMNLVRSNNYDDFARRNTGSVSASAEHRGEGRLSTFLLLRETIDGKSLLVPDFSAAARVKLTESGDHSLNANISRNSKIPTMNDLFWMPGGNPDLKNEYAFTYELSYAMNRSSSLPLNYSWDISLFRNSIKDMIQWQPGRYSFWTADNIKSVRTSGIEASLGMEYAIGKMAARLRASYAWTRAVSLNDTGTDETIDSKQLVYIPEHQANGALRLSFGRVYGSWVTGFTGKRYTEADNSKYLPSYIVSDLLSGIRLKVKPGMLDLSLNVSNIFNVDYQTVAYFPQPGRSYFLKLAFQFNGKTK